MDLQETTKTSFIKINSLIHAYSLLSERVITVKGLKHECYDGVYEKYFRAYIMNHSRFLFRHLNAHHTINFRPKTSFMIFSEVPPLFKKVNVVFRTQLRLINRNKYHYQIYSCDKHSRLHNSMNFNLNTFIKGK